MCTIIYNLEIFLLFRNKEGDTPLHLACMGKGNIGIVKVLITGVDSDHDGMKINSLLKERYVDKIPDKIIALRFSDDYFL